MRLRGSRRRTVELGTDYLPNAVNYAGAVSFEVRQPIDSKDLYVRFNFKNGTADKDFVAYPMFGRADDDLDVPLAHFDAALSVSPPFTSLPAPRLLH